MSDTEPLLDKSTTYAFTMVFTPAQDRAAWRDIAEDENIYTDITQLVKIVDKLRERSARLLALQKRAANLRKKGANIPDIVVPVRLIIDDIFRVNIPYIRRQLRHSYVDVQLSSQHTGPAPVQPDGHGG